jgi:hypothetical protein
MHHADGVRRGQTMRGRDIDVEDLEERSPALPPTQRDPVDQFHGEEHLAGVLPDLEHRCGVGVGQLRHCTGLSAQARGAESPGAQQLDCDVAPEHRVVAGVHHAEASLAESPGHHVAPDPLLERLCGEQTRSNLCMLAAALRGPQQIGPRRQQRRVARRRLLRLESRVQIVVAALHLPEAPGEVGHRGDPRNRRPVL